MMSIRFPMRRSLPLSAPLSARLSPSFAAGLLCSVLLAGCTVGPDYVRPEIDAPADWRAVPGKNAEKGAAPRSEAANGTNNAKNDAAKEDVFIDYANLVWWKEFGDPVLDGLIVEGLQNNRDIKIAAARVSEAAGYLGTTRAQFFPQIGIGADAARTRATERGPTPVLPGQSPIYKLYDASVSLSWEIDLFGRIRRATEAGEAQLQASEEARRGMALSIAATVAETYFNLLDADRELQISIETLRAREEAMRIFELRYKGGVVSELEVSQVRSELENARAAVPTLEQRVAQTENALSSLLGRIPGPDSYIPRGKRLDQVLLPQIPPGMPSALLERRPDLRQSEQQLIAANANIGVAKAAYFPTITLTALFGGSSTVLSKLFTGPARVWSYGGNLLMPIFTAGAIAGQVQVAEAQQQQALEGYKKSIENAFREVNDGLVASVKTQETTAARTRQAVALADYARVAQQRYENGYTSYLEVLDAERNLFSVQLTEAQTRGAALISLVELYKALGGGWEPASEIADEQTMAAANNEAKEEK